MRSDDNEDSLCIWDHCIKGMEHRTHKTSSKTKNSLDLRSHMAPKAAVDVYKVRRPTIVMLFTKYSRFNLVKALGLDQRKKIRLIFRNDSINNQNCLILTDLFYFYKNQTVFKISILIKFVH